MMIYIPLEPYYENLKTYWRLNRDNNLDQDFEGWLKQEQKTQLSRWHEQWRFDGQEDATMFILRWL